MSGKFLFINANLPSRTVLTRNSYDEIYANICNSYIFYSLSKIVGLTQNDTLCFNNLWRPQENINAAIQASEECEFAFIVLQDQLRTSFPDSDYESAIKNLQSLNKKLKLIAFSLSANYFSGPDLALVDQLSPARRRFFDYLAERCVSIGVRGHYTERVLERMQITNVRAVGCPSYFECGPNRLVDMPTHRASYSSWGTTGIFTPPVPDERQHYLQGDFEWPIISMMHAPEELWQEQRRETSLAKFLEPTLFEAAATGHAHFFSDFQAWKDHIRRNCRLVCGTRLHGAIVALNAGVPAIVTNSDARAQETCEFFGIPHRPEFQVTPPSAQGLMIAADPTQLNARYEERREYFLSWLRGCGVEVSETQSAPDLPSFEKISDHIIVRRFLSFQQDQILASHREVAEANAAGERRDAECERRVAEANAECERRVAEVELVLRECERRLARLDDTLVRRISRSVRSFGRMIRRSLGWTR